MRFIKRDYLDEFSGAGVIVYHLNLKIIPEGNFSIIIIIIWLFYYFLWFFRFLSY